MTEKDIFLAALDKTNGERRAFLDAICAGDPELRVQVEELLTSHDEAGSFLEQPAASPDTPTCTRPFDGDKQSDDPASVSTLTQDAAGELTFLEKSVLLDSLGRLDHYEVLEVIGRGGMGVVLKAHDTKLQRIVAVKLLAPQLAASGSARKRFAREAQAAAAVRDDHVVNIHAVSAEGPVPYLVMEFVAGITLDQRIRTGGPLEIKEILRIGMQTAKGLASAHAQGLIHRDVKPGNILLENGVQRVKITDFGLARAVDDASITQSGVIAGTPLYMSPEQARGEPVDPRSDLFSLGSVLYTLCTGRAAFRAGSTMAVLKRVCEDTPRPIREVNPDIPKWVCAVIGKLQAKNPAERFQSVAEVADLLERYLAHLQQPDQVPPPPPVQGVRVRSRWGWNRIARTVAGAAAALLLLTLTSVTAYLALRPRTGDQANRQRPGPTSPEQGGEPGLETWLPPRVLTMEELAKRPSPFDGRKREQIPVPLLTLAGDGDPNNAPLDLVAVLGNRRLLYENTVDQVAFADMGTEVIAADVDRTLTWWNTTTGDLIRRAHLAHGARIQTLAVSPDGRRLPRKTASPVMGV